MSMKMANENENNRQQWRQWQPVAGVALWLKAMACENNQWQLKMASGIIYQPAWQANGEISYGEIMKMA